MIRDKCLLTEIVIISKNRKKVSAHSTKPLNNLEIDKF